MEKLNRKWMYERLEGRLLKKEFTIGVREFIEFAKQHRDFQESSKIRCPCLKCKNVPFLDVESVREHLYKKGFLNDYYEWVCHGEDFDSLKASDEPSDPYVDMIIDAFGQVDGDPMHEDIRNVEEEPNPQVKNFFEMLAAAQKPLYEGSRLSVLEMASRITSLKCEYNLPHRCVDSISSLISDVIPDENSMSKTYYDTKKVVKGLELPHEKIHACPKGCMLFWKDKAHLEKCSKWGGERYKKTSRGKCVPAKVLFYFPIAPRLQRLYATKDLAHEMQWHSQNPRVSGTLSHPSDSEAWKHLDNTYKDFASEPRNVRLGLCTDGFSAHGKFGRQYSCWPVIVTPYNLPPWLCMKKPFMFLSLLIPGPKNPKGNLDVYMQPLIDELISLWEVGTMTYDVSTKQNFKLRAALLWTVSDFPAFGMLSGWTTSGKMACPYCMDKHRSFWLDNGSKVSWFDSHRQFLPPTHPYRKNRTAFFKKRAETRLPPPILTGHQLWEQVKEIPKSIDPKIRSTKSKKVKTGWHKQSIFWELPYWKDLLIRHNLDVMHIEKNFFDQLIHTIMNVKDTAVDTDKARLDVQRYCKRSSLEPIESDDGSLIFPKAPYTLDKVQRRVLCEWIKDLKFSDGYASDFGRCVDLQACKIHGMKSHDCHVFMERLLPVAMRELLPDNVWKGVTEISQFFRDLCSYTIKVDDVTRLEKNIPEILCKLEKIFPPAFFNSMEHLPVHLPHEVKVGGPVQYRWMYPFERFLNHLKKKIGNKARVEGSICKAYLAEEISNFCSYYFQPHVDTKSRDLGRNVVDDDDLDSTIPELFQFSKGRGKGVQTRFLDSKEVKHAHHYVLSNCGVLGGYERKFEESMMQKYPGIDLHDIWSKFSHEFSKWFQDFVIESNETDEVIRALAMGPSRQVKTWRQFDINGFKFHTFDYGKHKATMNYGVGVISEEEIDYFGILEEVIELVYLGTVNVFKTVLFKCNWMDSVNGMNIHEQYRLVDVNHSKKYPAYDPFVLAHQVYQVYFTSYPSLKKDKSQWWAVFKTKARSSVDAPIDESIFQVDIAETPTLCSSDDDDGVMYEDMDEMEEDGSGGEEEEQHEEDEWDDTESESEEEVDGELGYTDSDDEDDDDDDVDEE